ncbi:Holliday junction branch migration protein RuvA [Desulfogranum mediterraneum]|uniref:Holliday junction branch migration protein RuvA n=1 Tax=Desulfogranum mediterraneum TaxID=160661 RepID=UPI00041994E2|nr:Holliday junction branch migration protein RuvA [Desulfogranum mediterraneum]
MIASLNGILRFKDNSAVILDVQGVGYEVLISARTHDTLPRVGEECFLLIHTSVREDSITLYGFGDQEAKELFLLLVTVSGIGPKLALAILSGLGLSELCSAISMQDHARLTSISGVGKKTAQRLCVELAEKVTGLGLGGGVSPALAKAGAAPGTVPGGNGMQDAVSALVNLGYPQHLAWQALRQVQQRHPETADQLAVEELIRLALQGLAQAGAGR